MRDETCRWEFSLFFLFLAGWIMVGMSAGCGDSSRDCYQAGLCECTTREHCAEGLDCINGECKRLIPPPPPRKEFGEPCIRDKECLSDFCLPLGPGNGGVCSRECGLEECPEGWECKTHLPEDGSKAVDLCVQTIEKRLCHACAVSTQCNAIGDLCVSVGDQLACAADCHREDCPSGYTCTSIAVPGGTARQCLPTGGSCECSSLTVGLTRSCTVSNQHGSCYGLETCLDAEPVPVWGACDAGNPQQEVCNGLDDDCDGLTDAEDPGVDTSSLPGDLPYPSCRKGSELGDCTGLWICSLSPEGAWDWECGATDPENEVCNGRDDNCDGVVDDPFIDESGRYVHLEHCGGCGGDCRLMVPNLLLGDDGEVVSGAVECQVRAGDPLCVPRLCQPGTYPYPETAPVTCAELISSACQPCSQNADCRISTDVCVNVGEDPGTFCAQSCDPVSPYEGCSGESGVQGCCPDGQICLSMHGGLFCEPQAGTCTCNQERVGATRSCFLSGAGSQVCQGEQVCQAAGEDLFEWGDCLPSSVVVEVCDHLDNNCDGQVDEGFVDDQGVYFTDAHCGECNHNCLAQWDQEIQHAIGGCVEEAAGLDCRIVACTTEIVPGWGPCRRDEDCPSGTLCDPLYRHCVAADPGECPGGDCGMPCDSDQDCAQQAGPAYVCDPVTHWCQVDFQFADSNGEPTDGCECPVAAASDADEPDVSAQFPLPGEAYVDRNCDGVDGVAARALFVWSGSQQSQGTRQHPYATINEALAAFDSSVHDHVLVAAGYYQENLVLSEGVRLHGGYSPDFSTRDIVLYPSLVRGNQPQGANQPPGTVYAEGIRSRRTVVSGFTLHGYDVNTLPDPGQTAPSSYAVYIRDCNANLLVVNNMIVGGRGGQGGDGQPGTSGRNGNDGGDGQDSWECPDSQDCYNMERAGGSGGGNPGCTQAVGNAGATARGYAYDPQDYVGGGINGRGGSNSVYAHSDSSQWDFCKYDCQVGGVGISCNGEDARAGSEGNPGAGTAGCPTGSGSVSNGLFEAHAGPSGNNGTHGGGGGGGGAGGAVINQNAYTDCSQGNPFGDLGASGGGGGGGGCRGTGGAGGSGGGGSFGVFLYFTQAPQTLPVVRANRVRRGFGGNGGSGGGGGQGGLGGQAGEGGETVLPAWCAGSGGRGGRGGDGGAGGGGGGGCGGVSWGIATNVVDNPNQPSILDNLFETPGTSQTGGSGGSGGPSPAGTGYSGGSGAVGVSGDTWIY